jgi:hypothetical protein
MIAGRNRSSCSIKLIDLHLATIPRIELGTGGAVRQQKGKNVAHDALTPFFFQNSDEMRVKHEVR